MIVSENLMPPVSCFLEPVTFQRGVFPKVGRTFSGWEVINKFGIVIAFCVDGTEIPD